MTRLQQRDMQVQVILRVVGRLGDGPDRLPDLEAEIPEGIQDRFDQGFRGGGMTRHEHQQVDVAQRAEFGATVTPGGDEADRGGRRTGFQEKSVEQDVDRIGAQPGDLAATDAGAMGRQLDLTRFRQEHLGAWDELPLQGRLAGQAMLQRRATEQDRGRFVFGRHATGSP